MSDHAAELHGYLDALENEGLVGRAVGLFVRPRFVALEAELAEAKRERDAANNLLHGLTTEADANAAWKALILRAEAAEEKAARVTDERNDARYDNARLKDAARWLLSNERGGRGEPQARRLLEKALGDDTP